MTTVLEQMQEMDYIMTDMLTGPKFLRFSVMQENFLAALKRIKPAIHGKPSIPILSYVVLESYQGVLDSRPLLRIRATNLETEMVINIPAYVDDIGAVCVPYKTLVEMVATWPPERIDFIHQRENGKAKVTCTNTITLNTLPASDYPAMRQVPPRVFVVDGKQLGTAISAVAKSAAVTDSRPILNAINMVAVVGGPLVLTAADGYQIGTQQVNIVSPNWEPFTANVPAKALKAIAAKLEGDVWLCPEKTGLTLVNGLATIRISTMEGPFPDTSALIPETYVTRVVGSAVYLLEELKRANVFARDDDYRVQLKMDWQFGIDSCSQETGNYSSTFFCSLDGVANVVSLNIKQLTAALTKIGKQDFALEFSGMDKPVTVYGTQRDSESKYYMARMKSDMEIEEDLRSRREKEAADRLANKHVYEKLSRDNWSINGPYERESEPSPTYPYGLISFQRKLTHQELEQYLLKPFSANTYITQEVSP